jgi:hypothetical protein
MQFDEEYNRRCKLAGTSSTDLRDKKCSVGNCTKMALKLSSGVLILRC